MAGKILLQRDKVGDLATKLLPRAFLSTVLIQIRKDGYAKISFLDQVFPSESLKQERGASKILSEYFVS